ncbi:MAG: hypothetical protein JW958_03455 [Candidatus Eisenbacteria bacterium]|nr:hypothetical protein [Candidatus Eisenbacteria bacterium]
MKGKRFLVTLAMLPVLAWLAAACDDNTTSAPDANVPPTTMISGGPESFGESTYRADLKWYGVDVDGSIEYFEYAFDDTSEWLETAFNGSTFVLSSNEASLFDTLIAASGADSIVERFGKYHTFFVRSVDDDNAMDPTPAFLTFNSTTVAPRTTITKGPLHDGMSGRAVSIRWEGADPDNPTNAVAAYEYFDATKKVMRSRYGYIDPPAGPGVTRKIWNSLDWIRVGADTTQVVLKALETGYGDAGGNRHMFFVRSIDEAGAVEQIPVVRENWREWGVSNDPGGQIIVRSNVMGTAIGNPDNNANPHVGQIFEGTRIVFSWYANLASYDGTVTGYGWAYDNPIWSPWDVEMTRYPVSGDYTPTIGRHTFYVRAKDEAGLIIRQEFPFEVHPGPPKDTTNIFLLCDFYVPGYIGQYPTPTQYVSYWEDSLLVNFNRARSWTPRLEADNDPPILRMVEASTMILTLDDWEFGTTIIAVWNDNNINPIWSYVDAGGNLFIVGFMPGWSFLPDNDMIDTGAVAEPDPCFDYSSYKSCGSSLIWYQPLMPDSFPHPLYEYAALETTWLDDQLDYMWGAKSLYPSLPDLHVDSTRSELLQSFDGLWKCEGITIRKNVGAVPLYAISRVKGDPMVPERPNAVWMPSDGARGHVVYMSMPLYFMKPDEAKEAVEAILIRLFNEQPRF